jgi:hypothetical protein
VPLQGELVRAQKGDLYGDWITSKIVECSKGGGRLGWRSTTPGEQHTADERHGQHAERSRFGHILQHADIGLLPLGRIHLVFKVSTDPIDFFDGRVHDLGCRIESLVSARGPGVVICHPTILQLPHQYTASMPEGFRSIRSDIDAASGAAEPLGPASRSQRVQASLLPGRSSLSQS